MREVSSLHCRPDDDRATSLLINYGVAYSNGIADVTSDEALGVHHVQTACE
jgi:hypothetical protein